MKKMIILLTVLALICASLCSCGDNEEEVNETEKGTVTESEAETETYDTDFEKYDTDENWTPYL